MSLIFKNRKQKVEINIGGKKFETHTTCGPKDWNNLKVGSKKLILESGETNF